MGAYIVVSGMRLCKLNRSLSYVPAVRSLRSVPEATSDSDDEDKLHIVEEDSIHDDPGQKPSAFQLKASQQDTVSQDGE